MKTPIVQAGCMDCDLVTNHTTTTAATTALEAHVTEMPEHRPLIGDNRGWHRAWVDV